MRLSVPGREAVYDAGCNMKIAEAGGGEFGGLGKMFCKIRQSSLQWQRNKIKLKPGFNACTVTIFFLLKAL